MTSTRGLQAIAGWSGIVFALLSGLILVLSPGWPPLGAATAEVVAYHLANFWPFLVGNYLATLAIVPGILQLVAITALVRRTEGEGAWLHLLVLATGLVAHATGGGVLIVYQAVPFLAELPIAARTLSDLGGVAFALFLVVLLGFVLAMAWAIYATKILPRGLGHAAVPVGLLLLVGSLGSIWTPRWLAGGGVMTLVALSAFFVWVVVMSVVLLSRGETVR